MAKIRESMSEIELKSWPSYFKTSMQSEQKGRRLERIETNSAGLKVERVWVEISQVIADMAALEVTRPGLAVTRARFMVMEAGLGATSQASRTPKEGANGLRSMTRLMTLHQ